VPLWRDSWLWRLAACLNIYTFTRIEFMAIRALGVLISYMRMHAERSAIQDWLSKGHTTSPKTGVHL
jgi:hypothetical protein